MGGRSEAVTHRHGGYQRFQPSLVFAFMAFSFFPPNFFRFASCRNAFLKQYIQISRQPFVEAHIQCFQPEVMENRTVAVLVGMGASAVPTEKRKG